ncbi:hypothetical protein V2J09_007053 [Rumex salicifolius]
MFFIISDPSSSLLILLDLQRDTNGGFSPIIKLPFNLPFLSCNSYTNVLFIRFCNDAYTPTMAKNVEDYLASTYELCEDG